MVARLKGRRSPRDADPRARRPSLDDLTRWLNPIVAGWVRLLWPVLPVGDEPLPRRVSAYLRRLAGKKVQAAANLQAVQAVLDWATPTSTRTVRRLAMGPFVLRGR